MVAGILAGTVRLQPGTRAVVLYGPSVGAIIVYSRDMGGMGDCCWNTALADQMRNRYPSGSAIWPICGSHYSVFPGHGGNGGLPREYRPSRPDEEPVPER